MKKIELTKNQYGVFIKKCCASCKHLQYEKKLVRKCQFDGYAVKPDDLCEDWEMNKNLEAAGIGGGSVKKKSYLMYVLNYNHPDNPLLHVTLKGMRWEYEQKFGTIYQDF